MAQRVKLVFTGFEELLDAIEKAGGDIKPAVNTALQESINLIDADHFCTENPVIPVLKNKLSEAFPRTEFIVSSVHKQIVNFA